MVDLQDDLEVRVSSCLSLSDLEEHYSGRRFVGCGRWGRVYRAVDRRTGGFAALKQIALDSLDVLGEVTDEVRALQSLDHPGIVRFYDFYSGEDGDGTPLLYIAMEFASGKTLAQHLAGGKRFSEEELRSIKSQALDALEEAHGKGIVHRDVKPANLVYSDDGVLKVADFGIPKFLGERSRTRTLAAGTAFYMAPEQSHGGAISPATDYYGLGMTLVALASGREADIEMEANPSGQIRKLSHLSVSFRRSLELMLDADPGRRKQGLTENIDGSLNESLIVQPSVPVRGFVNRFMRFVGIWGGDSRDLVAAQCVQPVVGVVNVNNYLRLENISCIDADNHAFEHYDFLLVNKDVEMDQNQRQKNFIPFDAVVHFERHSNRMLPSFALSCNIIAALFNAAVRKQGDGSYQVLDVEAKKVLDQYKTHGNSYGWHCQNTIVDFGAGAVVHYPSGADFGRDVAVNSSRARILNLFDKSALEDGILEDALLDPSKRKYICQLTGLQNPSILVDVGKYFGKPAKLWFPWNGRAGSGYNEKRAAWLGCGYDDFNLLACDYLGGSIAARGVSFVGAEGAAPQSSSRRQG